MSGLRWGVLGTGGIASSFARDLVLLEGSSVVAVGSRRQETADRFAAEHGVARAYGSYDRLVADPGVDAVYVAVPHPGHHAAAAAAIGAGKAVLVEKPFTMDAAQAQDLVDRAEAAGTFLMEAMWTRFLPHVVRIRALLADGALGDVRTLVAEHNQWFARDPEHRLFAPGLGGGALLDLGVYPVSFASMVLGPPSAVTAVSDAAFTGVDATTSMLLQHASGAHAVLTTSLEAAGVNAASVSGTEARLDVDGTFYAPTTFTLTARDGRVLERYHVPHEGSGHRHQAAEVARCVDAGRTGSDVLPPAETVSVMATLDEVRHQIGLVYPDEG